MSVWARARKKANQSQPSKTQLNLTLNCLYYSMRIDRNEKKIDQIIEKPTIFDIFYVISDTMFMH